MYDSPFTYDEDEERRRRESAEALASAGELSDGRLPMSAGDFPSGPKGRESAAADVLASAFRAPPTPDRTRDAVDELAGDDLANVLKLGTSSGLVKPDPVDSALEGLTGSKLKTPYNPELGDTTDNRPEPDADDKPGSTAKDGDADDRAGMVRQIDGKLVTPEQDASDELAARDEIKRTGKIRLTNKTGEQITVTGDQAQDYFSRGYWPAGDSATTPGPNDPKKALVKQETTKLAPGVTATQTELVEQKKDPSEPTLPPNQKPDAKPAPEPTPASTTPQDKIGAPATQSGTAEAIHNLRQRLAAGSLDATDELAARKPGVNPWAIVGMLADLGFNRGRNIGQIASSEAARQQQEVQNRLAAAKAKGGDAFEREAKLIGLDLEAKRAENAGKGLELSDQRRQDLEAWRNQQKNLESELNHTKESMRQLLAAAGVRGRRGAEHKLVDQTADDRRVVNQAGRQGTLDADHANNERTTADKAHTSKAVAVAGEVGRNTAQGTAPRPITPDQAVHNQLEREKLNAQLEEMKIRRDQLAIDKHKQDFDKFNAEYQPTVEALAQARWLQNFMDTHRGDIDTPGIGLYDANKPGFMKSDEEVDIGKRLAWFRNPQIHEQFGSAFTTPEQKLAWAQLGDASVTNPYELESALKVANEVLGGRIRNTGRDDIAREALDKQVPGLAETIFGPKISPAEQELIDEAMRQQNGGGGGIEAPPPAAAPAAPARVPAPAGAGKPQLNHDGHPVSGELGDTGGMRDVQPIPTAPGGSKPTVVANMQSGPPVTVTLRSPTGQVGKKTIDPQTLARLLTNDWSIVEQ